MNCGIFVPLLLILIVIASLLIPVYAKKGYDEGYEDAKEELNKENEP